MAAAREWLVTHGIAKPDAILLSGRDEPFPSQLIRKLADTFEFTAAVLYDRRSGEVYRAGASDFEGLDRLGGQDAVDERHGPRS